MDENTKAFIEVGKKLHKDNEATLAELKKISKPSTLQQSTQENAGEILSGILIGALDRKAEAEVAKGTNLGVGVSAKNGIDIVPGGEPRVDEKDTLFGITKAFYDKYNFGNLINSTKEVTKNLDEQKKTLVLSNGMMYKGFKEQRNIFQKLLDFFKKSDSSSGVASKQKKSKLKKEETLFQRLVDSLDTSKEKKGFGAGFRGGVGITGLKDKLSGMLKSFKGFPMMIGAAIAIPFRLIGKGLFKLGATLLKPLGSIVKGIASLPGKILGFFGGALGMLGRLALLGGGIFALSKLTDYLRGVGSAGQESFVDMLMVAFEKVKAVFGFLKNVITDTLIPVMLALAEAIFQTIAFLSGIIPGIEITKGNAAPAERKLRADNPRKSSLLMGDDDIPRMMDEEEYEAFIQKKIAEDKKERLKNYALKHGMITHKFKRGEQMTNRIILLNAMERLRPEFEKQERRTVIIGGQEVIGGADASLSKTIKSFKDDMLLIEKNRTGGNVANVVSQKNQANNNINHFTEAQLRFLLKDTNNFTKD